MKKNGIYSAQERNKITGRAFKITLTTHCLLSVMKLLAGVFGKSSAMMSDAVNTLSDVLTTLLVMAAVRMAGKKRDEGHHYGHEKIESIMGLLLAFVLAATALMIGKGGVESLLAGKTETITPGLVAFIAAVISIAAQEMLYQVARSAGKRLNSPVMMAEAWHHRSDSLSAIGALVGIGAARWLDMWYMEHIASIFICLIIVYSAYRIGIDCVNQLIDAAPPAEKIDEIIKSAVQVEGVSKIDVINCRRHANKLFVDIELSIANHRTFEEAHGICEEVHQAVEEAHPEVIHCMVHANPLAEE